MLYHFQPQPLVNRHGNVASLHAMSSFLNFSQRSSFLCPRISSIHSQSATSKRHTINIVSMSDKHRRRFEFEKAADQVRKEIQPTQQNILQQDIQLSSSLDSNLSQEIASSMLNDSIPTGTEELSGKFLDDVQENIETDQVSGMANIEQILETEELPSAVPAATPIYSSISAAVSTSSFVSATSPFLPSSSPAASSPVASSPNPATTTDGGIQKKKSFPFSIFLLFLLFLVIMGVLFILKVPGFEKLQTSIDNTMESTFPQLKTFLNNLQRNISEAVQGTISKTNEFITQVKQGSQK